MTEKDVKSCFSVKKLISTSEQHAEHPLTGGNTQQVFVVTESLLTLHSWSTP